MFTFFSNPLLCLKQGAFRITQTDERKGTKTISQLVWYKKSVLGLRQVYDTTQIFLIEFVPFDVHSLTDYLKQKSALHML